MTALWSFWNNVAQPAIARLKPGEWTLLTRPGSLVGRSLRLSRTLSLDLDGGMDSVGQFPFRAASRLGMHIPLRYLPAVEQAAFVIAMGLFAGAVLAYIRPRICWHHWLRLLCAVAGFAVARALLWPDSLTLRVALEVSYRIVLLTAAIAC